MGKGLKSKRIFLKGDMVCEYAGELMSKANGVLREVTSANEKKM
jgi:hypothetical protein